MRSLFIIFTVLFGMVLIWHADLRAQAPENYCQRAESTADIMVCAKKHYDDSQKELSRIYEKVLNIPPDSNDSAQNEEQSAVQTLRQSQKDWISYRDGECARQTQQEESESLKRLKELSCLADLTRQRADTLLVQLEEKEKQARIKIVNPLPTWMNVLANSNPAIFWRYHDRLQADLNCDEQSDEIMVGLDASDSNNLKVVVAISDNPLTGRPNIQIFDFKIGENVSKGTMCHSDLKLSIFPLPVSKGKNRCAVALRIEDQKCASYTVVWNGSAYEHLTSDE